jgi:hypothetical protein
VNDYASAESRARQAQVDAINQAANVFSNPYCGILEAAFAGPWRSAVLASQGLSA